MSAAISGGAGVASLRRRQGETLVALVPAICAMLWWQGADGVLRAGAIGLVAVACDLLFSRLRGLSWLAMTSELSALIHATLLALWLPLLAPGWAAMAGAVVAMAIKHLYGGAGQSPWHPTLAGVASVMLLAPAAFLAPPHDASVWAALATALGTGWMLWRRRTSRMAAFGLLLTAALAYSILLSLMTAAPPAPWQPAQAPYWLLVAGFVFADRDSGLPPAAAFTVGMGIALLTLSLQLGGIRLPAAIALAALGMNLATPWLQCRFEPSAFRQGDPT